MNTIGIDYQQTISAICLREGQGTDQIRNVGDGIRHVIPNAVCGEELWGSRALLTPVSTDLSEGDPVHEGPWLDEPGARLFWQGIVQRLYSYLGRVNPVSSNGYQVVVSLQTTNFGTAAKSIKQLCRAVSLGEVSCISSCDALLCRWLGAQRANGVSSSTVVAVVVGDTTTAITAYHLQWSTNRSLLRLKSGHAVYLPQGHSMWMSRMLELIHERFNEPLSHGYELALRDAVIEYVIRLSREKTKGEVEWTGLFRERMYAPLALSVQDCASWSEAIRFSQTLPPAIGDALADINARKPDLILIGGIGAFWPFVMDTVAQEGTPWRSTTPQEDVAYGATRWPEFEARFAGIMLSPDTELIKEWSTGDFKLSEEIGPAVFETDLSGLSLVVEPEMDEESTNENDLEGPLLPPSKR